MRLVNERDIRWVRTTLMERLALTRLVLAEAPDHTASYPDIWCDTSTATITVTPEWARQELHERRKRITHEALHLKGLGHGDRERQIGYYSRPARDRFSWAVYRAVCARGRGPVDLDRLVEGARMEARSGHQR